MKKKGRRESPCCACNGENACKSCFCVKAGQPCLPLCHAAKDEHCSNLNALSDAPVTGQVESSQGMENTCTLTSFQSSASGASSQNSSVSGASSQNSSTTLPTLQLLDAVAEVAQLLSNTIVDWKGIKALMSSRLTNLQVFVPYPSVRF